jgi:hypothetical protein
MLIRVVVKSANYANETSKVILNREHYWHRIPEIASSPYIRSLLDTVQISDDEKDPPALVLEWMDMDLRVLPAERFRGDMGLFKATAKGMLSGLAVFEKLNLVHTGKMSQPQIVVSH